jgi:uncharacterized lipoprotein YehR (DUF1307 family)
MRKFILTLVLALSLSACTTTKYIEVPVEIEKVRTEYIIDHRVDSIYERDSTDRYSKNDTIFIYKEKVKNRYIYKTDTIVRTDSIPYVVETKITTTKEVNVLKWYQKALMYLGLSTLGALVFMVYRKFN